jgi:hypothetical protein
MNLRNTLIKSGKLLNSHINSSSNVKHEHQKEDKPDCETTEVSKDHVGRMRRKTSLDIRTLGGTFDMF